MPHTPMTHALYPGIPQGPLATAICYHCGIELPAEYLGWLRHPAAGQYLAFCWACYANHRAEYGLHEIPSPGASRTAS